MRMIRTGEQVVVTPPLSRPAASSGDDTPTRPAAQHLVHDGRHGEGPRIHQVLTGLQAPRSGPGTLAALADVEVTHRAGFAYVTGITADGEELRLCRLRYGGSASLWGFSIYRASHDDYHPSVLPNGLTAGSPEDALDTACGLYLGDPTAWIPPPKD